MPLPSNHLNDLTADHHHILQRKEASSVYQPTTKTTKSLILFWNQYKLRFMAAALNDLSMIWIFVLQMSNAFVKPMWNSIPRYITFVFV